MAPEVHTTPCPHCGKTYTSNTRICPDDGSVIEHASAVTSQVGAVLDGKYRLDSFLSQGGMGAVYKATHVMLGKTIAVKLINPELVTSSDIVRRFQREARAATALNHPNIVSVYDLGQTADGTLYIAMEYVDGPSLKDVIERGHGVAPARAINLLRQVAAALSRAHRAGIIHRDLKPHNIMLSKSDDGRELVKLVDFGIAKTFDEKTKLTSTGFPIGTPHYMPPEQASGGEVDARSDLYSVGIILYEMLTGVVPFDDTSTPAILIKQVKEVPTPPSVRTPGVIPPALDEIALRLLQKNPADRFQTAEELGAALDEAAVAIVAPDVTVPMPRPSGIPSQRTPVQRVSAVDPTVAAPGRTPAAPPVPAAAAPAAAAITAAASTPAAAVTAPGAAGAATAAAPIAASATAVAPVLPSAPPGPATAPASKSSGLVLVAFLIAGIIATLGAAYYYNSRGSTDATTVATTASGAASGSQSADAAPAGSPQATPPPATPPSAASTPGAATAANANGKSTETPSTPSTPVASGAATAPLNAPPPADPSSAAKVSSSGNASASGTRTSSAPPPPPSPQNRTGVQTARGFAPPPPAAAAIVAGGGKAAEARPPASAPAGSQGAAPAAARREEPPAQAAAPPAFPERPSVYFRCAGPTEVCAPMRSAVDEALGGAGLTSVRRANAADVDVSAQVEVLQQNVDRQFGTVFAVRTYSIALSGETTKSGEVVSMPSVDNLSFDQRLGGERANERARVVAAGVVERVKAFAAAKRSR